MSTEHEVAVGYTIGNEQSETLLDPIEIEEKRSNVKSSLLDLNFVVSQKYRRINASIDNLLFKNRNKSQIMREQIHEQKREVSQVREVADNIKQIMRDDIVQRYFTSFLADPILLVLKLFP